MMQALTLETVYRELAAMTGLPVVTVLRQMQPLGHLPEVERRLAQNLVGQDEAVQAVVASLRSRLLRGVEARPTLCLLCVGPTGVGKTELALQLGDVFSGSREQVLRLDGSEFREEHTVSRLIGAPPGYKGHGRSGQLTEGARRLRRGVILVDEVEKAHPAVRNLFLQVMSAGRLTDAMGLAVDFRHMCVVMTSNVGAREVERKGEIGWPRETAGSPGSDGRVLEAVRAEFAPEFLGRFDRIVMFQPLREGHLTHILAMHLQQLAESVPGISSLEVEPGAAAALVAEAQALQSGARGIDHAIRLRIEPGLAELHTRGQLRVDGRQVVHITHNGGAYVFTA